MQRLCGREVLLSEGTAVEGNLVDVESGQPGIELRGEALVFEGLDSSSQGAYRRAQRSVLDGEELNAYSKRVVLSKGGMDVRGALCTRDRHASRLSDGCDLSKACASLGVDVYRCNVAIGAPAAPAPMRAMP